MSDALPYWYVCVARCSRPAVFIWLCKFHTIEDHVLCHATVVSITNKRIQNRGKSASARCTILLESSVQCIHSLLYVLDNAVTHNTSRRPAAGRLIALLVHLLTAMAWYSTWSSIVSNLHNHPNAALRPQRAMQTELTLQAASNNI